MSTLLTNSPDAPGTESAAPVLAEIFTGRLRPRHWRFSYALEQLLGKDRLQVVCRPPDRWTRLKMGLGCRRRGFRALSPPAGDLPCLVHQSLSLGSGPYLCEFDLPLAIHNYEARYHRASADRARALLEQDNLRGIVVFSEWARRSFTLYYGPAVGEKCRVVYPLAFESMAEERMRERRYDFCFISTQFRIKCGPELVQAFSRVRSAHSKALTLCIVTNLGEAGALLGDLSAYPGIEWREANLSEQEIAALLADSRCLVHPSLAESFGVVALEALAAGCALITTDIASFPEMVQDGVNGFLLPAPVSTMCGEVFLVELGNARYFADFLNTLSLHRMTEALEDVLFRVSADEGRLDAMMRASSDLYRRRFAVEVWQQTMRTVLYDAFPDSPASDLFRSLGK